MLGRPAAAVHPGGHRQQVLDRHRRLQLVNVFRGGIGQDLDHRDIDPRQETLIDGDSDQRRRDALGDRVDDVAGVLRERVDDGVEHHIPVADHRDAVDRAVCRRRRSTRRVSISESMPCSSGVDTGQPSVGQSAGSNTTGDTTVVVASVVAVAATVAGGATVVDGAVVVSSAVSSLLVHPAMSNTTVRMAARDGEEASHAPSFHFMGPPKRPGRRRRGRQPSIRTRPGSLHKRRRTTTRATPRRPWRTRAFGEPLGC